MILQVEDLLNAVFRKLQVATKGVNTDITEMNNALQDLNIMLDEFSADTLMCMGSIMVSFPLIGGQAAYTIGAGGNFNGVRPNRITDVFVRDSSGSDYPLDIVALNQYNDNANKSIDLSTPSQLYYDTGAPQQVTPMGIINIWPAPDTSYTLFIGEQQSLSEFSALTDIVTFLPVYYSLLMWNLTERLYPEYPLMGDKEFATVLKMARSSQRAVETLNFKKVVSDDLEIPTTGGSRFNILTGQYQ
jgi:hypothetical protein